MTQWQSVYLFLTKQKFYAEVVKLRRGDSNGSASQRLQKFMVWVMMMVTATIIKATEGHCGRPGIFMNAFGHPFLYSTHFLEK